MKPFILNSVCMFKTEIQSSHLIEQEELVLQCQNNLVRHFLKVQFFPNLIPADPVVMLPSSLQLNRFFIVFPSCEI